MPVPLKDGVVISIGNAYTKTTTLDRHLRLVPEALQNVVQQHSLLRVHNLGLSPSKSKQGEIEASDVTHKAAKLRVFSLAKRFRVVPPLVRDDTNQVSSVRPLQNTPFRPTRGAHHRAASPRVLSVLGQPGGYRNVCDGLLLVFANVEHGDQVHRYGRGSGVVEHQRPRELHSHGRLKRVPQLHRPQAVKAGRHQGLVLPNPGPHDRLDSPHHLLLHVGAAHLRAPRPAGHARVPGLQGHGGRAAPEVGELCQEMRHLGHRGEHGIPPEGVHRHHRLLLVAGQRARQGPEADRRLHRPESRSLKPLQRCPGGHAPSGPGPPLHAHRTLALLLPAAGSGVQLRVGGAVVRLPGRSQQGGEGGEQHGLGDRAARQAQVRGPQRRQLRGHHLPCRGHGLVRNRGVPQDAAGMEQPVHGTPLPALAPQAAQLAVLAGRVRLCQGHVGGDPHQLLQPLLVGGAGGVHAA